MDLLKKFFSGNRSRGFFSGVKKCFIKKKSEILKIAAIISLLCLVAFLVEYFGFGRSFNQYRFLLILAIETLIAFFALMRSKIGEKPEIGFLAIALICGSLLSISEPKKFVNWDEQIHYKNAEKISLALLGGPSRPNTTPASYSLAEQQKINVEIDNQYKKAKVKSRDFSEVFSYGKIAYFPSSLALMLGELLHLPYHVIFVLGRCINLAAYSLIVYFALRKLKTGKMIMAVVALFPTAIFLASNYNYDSWVTAFTMLGLAYFFAEIQEPEKKLTTKNAVIMLGAFLIGLGPKPIYFPLMFLLFLIPMKKFASSGQYKKFILATAFSIFFVVGSFLLPFLLGGSGGDDHRGGAGVNSAQQVHFIFSQPFAYAKTLSNFMVGYVNPLNAGGFVSFFAYLGMTKGFWLWLLLLALVVFLDRNQYDEKMSGWKMKLWMIGVYLATVSLICTALYVSFTPVASNTIAGVQPRYLIPLVFPLLIVVANSRFRNPFNKNFFNSLIFATASALLLFGIWDLTIRFYH